MCWLLIFIILFFLIIFARQIFLYVRKERFIEVFKNLTNYTSENNFVMCFLYIYFDDPTKLFSDLYKLKF